MYQVSFEEIVKGRHVVHDAEFLQVITCLDLERALALASMLQKMSTDDVQYVNIVVEPKIVENHETEKK